MLRELLGLVFYHKRTYIRHEPQTSLPLEDSPSVNANVCVGGDCWCVVQHFDVLQANRPPLHRTIKSLASYRPVLPYYK